MTFEQMREARGNGLSYDRCIDEGIGLEEYEGIKGTLIRYRGCIYVLNNTGYYFKRYGANEWTQTFTGEDVLKAIDDAWGAYYDECEARGLVP